jgi:anti-sigma factor RsiW
VHDNYTMLMSLVLDRKATPEEALLLEKHLATCPTCAITWKQWREVDRLLATAPVLTPPRSYTDAVLARLDEHRRLRKQARRPGLDVKTVRSAMLGACVLTAAGLAWWSLRHLLEVGRRRI